MTATVRITVPPAKAPAYNPTTGLTADPEPDVIYEGLARIQVKTSLDKTANAADQAVTSRDYLVSVPQTTTDIPVGARPARLQVTGCLGDSGLVGRVLTVIDVAFGSESWQRDLTCRDDLTNQPD